MNMGRKERMSQGKDSEIFKQTIKYRAEVLGLATSIGDIELRYYKDCFSKAHLDRVKERVKELFSADLTHLTIFLPTMEELNIDNCFEWLLRSINHEYLCFIIYFLQSKNAARKYDKVYVRGGNRYRGYY
jgi:hypothetical protein